MYMYNEYMTQKGFVNIVIVAVVVVIIGVVGFLALTRQTPTPTLIPSPNPETSPISAPKLGRPEFGSQDFAVVEAVVLSSDGIKINVSIDKILEYRRDDEPSWKKLQEGDRVLISIAIAKLVPRESSDAGTPGQITPTTVDAKDLGEERIAQFVSSLVGKKVVLSMNCGHDNGCGEGRIQSYK